MQDNKKQTISAFREEFQRQYHDLFDWVSRYAALRVPHARDREDVISETFLCAHKRLGQYDPSKGSMRQWMAGIVRRQVIDYWRRRRCDAELDESVLAAFDPPMGDLVDARRLFERALDGLSPEHRALFILRYVDGLTHEEIADMTGRHPTAIRSFFSRALRDMRKRFNFADV